MAQNLESLKIKLLIYYRYKMIDDYHLKKWRKNIVFEKKNYTIWCCVKTLLIINKNKRPDQSQIYLCINKYYNCILVLHLYQAYHISIYQYLHMKALDRSSDVSAIGHMYRQVLNVQMIRTAEKYMRQNCIFLAKISNTIFKKQTFYFLHSNILPRKYDLQ